MENEVCFGADLVYFARQGGHASWNMRIREDGNSQLAQLFLVPVSAAALLPLVRCDLLALALSSVRHLFGYLVLYRPGWLEDRDVASGYEYRFAGMRITCLAGVSLDDLESTKAADLNVLMANERTLHFSEELVDDRGDFLFGKAGLVCNAGYDISLRHFFPLRDIDSSASSFLLNWRCRLRSIFKLQYFQIKSDKIGKGNQFRNPLFQGSSGGGSAAALMVELTGVEPVTP